MERKREGEVEKGREGGEALSTNVQHIITGRAKFEIKGSLNYFFRNFYIRTTFRGRCGASTSAILCLHWANVTYWCSSVQLLISV